MLTFLRNHTVNLGRYKEHSEAIVVSCYFNPEQSPYRTMAFCKFYKSIQHLNHAIVECVIGNNKPELPEVEGISRVYAKDLLWHKESLLNLLIDRLPLKYKYVFWVDADVTFTNLNWLRDGVREFKKGSRILQPFEYCVHLEKDESKPDFDVEKFRNRQHSRMWRSFCANFVTDRYKADSTDYNTHGHVGFAWGATREVLNRIDLYDRALIGGADHIIAHAAANQIPSNCIDKSFTDDLENVYDWSRKFSKIVDGKIGYVKGDLYHTWHGDIKHREYLKRIKEFTPTAKQITVKDKNGLYEAKSVDTSYVKTYFQKREVKSTGCTNCNCNSSIVVNSTAGYDSNTFS